jgi:hypothetical protein
MVANEGGGGDQAALAPARGHGSGKVHGHTRANPWTRVKNFLDRAVL